MATLFTIKDQLRPIAETMIPKLVGCGDSAYAAFVERVDLQLDKQPKSVGRQLQVFVSVLLLLAWLRHFRPWSRLSVGEREALLMRVQDSKITKLRIGAWGLRTLLYMGHYAHPEVQEQLGYAPNMQGWTAYQGAHRG